MGPKGIEDDTGAPVQTWCVVTPGTGGPQVQRLWSTAYLALTADEVVLVRAKRGLTRMKPDGVIARMERTAVTGGGAGDAGPQRSVRLDVRRGGAWSFGLPPFQARRARDVLAALAVTPS